MISVYYCCSPIGKLRIEIEDAFLIGIKFTSGEDKDNYISAENCEFIEEPPEKDHLANEVIKQLNEYFDGTRKSFDLPLRLKGTDFHKRDWEALRKIPYGETRSYKDIAEAIDCPRGYRAVGLANNRNPVLIVVPCHRVIGSDGSMVGFGGGLRVKEYLLELEKKNLQIL